MTKIRLPFVLDSCPTRKFKIIEFKNDEGFGSYIGTDDVRYIFDCADIGEYEEEIIYADHENGGEEQVMRVLYDEARFVFVEVLDMLVSEVYERSE